MLRLTVTRWGGASGNAASRMRQHPSRRLHLQASGTATCLFKIRPVSTKLEGQNISQAPRIAITRPFSHTARRPSPPGGGKPDQPAPPRPSARRSPVRWGTYAGLFALLVTYIIWDGKKEHNARNLLNTERFTTCTVESVESVSHAAFILTIQAPATATTNNDAVLRKAWAHGLWSVEIKQPQLQIARHYTPLPPAPLPPRGQHESLERGVTSPDMVTLRFFIRRYDGGEVSTYLSRLKQGDRVEIRGPHLGFDVGKRLGDAGRRVVFLAGGTGIAPAMQVAAYLMEHERAGSVQILWANRSAADCAGCPRALVNQKGWFSASKEHAAKEEYLKEEPSPIVRQLRHFQAAYKEKGHTLDVQCAVDEEGGMFQAQDIMGAVIRARSLPGQASSSCYFHSQGQLVHSTEEHDAVTSRKEGGEAVSLVKECSCEGGGSTGKNLFIISGPDGFVGAYVGPKVWADGAERQGPVGGLVAELRKKEPTTWKDWLVLKQ